MKPYPLTDEESAALRNIQADKLADTQRLLDESQQVTPTQAPPTKRQIAGFLLVVVAAAATIVITCSQRVGLDVVYTILTWGL